MSQHAALWPILIPFVAALAQIVVPLTQQRRIAALAAILSLGAASGLLWLCDDGILRVYALGSWAPPFGIVLVADRLAAGMVLLTTLLGGACLFYASAGTDAQGRYFHPIYQLQLVGINGAFLTGDLFNLFVFFEIMLLASYLLLAQGGGRTRTRAGLIYVVINLLGSSLFLVALGTLYGTLGTLNLADVAWRASMVGDNDAVLRVALLLLVAVFVLKAALLPLSFWLPQTYAAAPAPVAALFSIMTKVGIVALLRVHVLIIAPNFPELAAAWLTPLALATLAFGVLGVLAAPSLRSQAAWLVLISAGTLQCVPGLATVDGSAAGLYYLAHSTFTGAAFFLLAELVAERRGAALCTFAPVMPGTSRAPAVLGAAFLVLAVASVGLPPLSGFAGKLLLLRSTLTATWSPALTAGFWCVLLSASFASALALARAGGRIFWTGGATPNNRQGRDILRPTALILLIAASPLLVILAEPVHAYVHRTASQVHAVEAYIHGVLGGNPQGIERTLREPPAGMRKDRP